MKFPVDLLADVSQAELEQSAHNYMNNLLYSNPDSPEQLTLSDSTTVTINIANVGVLPLYGHNDEQKILALFSPNELFKAVALYLLDQWWTMEDILKTANPARDGVVKVETLGERIVLYILNRVIYRAKEISSLEEEVPFLCHEEKDYAKIHWNNGEAVGFYSVKPTGSLCNSFTPRSYQLPVMDSIFVRKRHRGKGFGLQMLEDFVLSFKDEYLGLRYPLTKPMYKVCEKYLRQYPRGTDLLWEVEREGAPGQRTNIASKIQTMDLSAVSRNLFMEESLVITEVTENDVVMGAITTQINEAGSMECRVEIVEEVTVPRGTKEADDVPVAARSRSSGSKRRKTGEKISEDKSEKMIRIEDIEAETPTEEHISKQQKNEAHTDSEMVQTESVLSVATEEKAEDEVDNAAEESAPRVTDKLTSQDLEEAEVTSAPAAEESQIVDDGTRDLNDTSCDSQIRVENVASELEGADEESQEEDTAVLVVSDDVLEMYKEEEALDKMEEVTQGKVSDENSEEPTKHELSLSAHAASEGGDAGKTERTVRKTIKTVQSKVPRRRSQRLSKAEEGVKEETAAQDGRKVLRGRTVVNSPALKRKYHRHSQKVCEELDKEINEVAEKEPPTTEVVEGQEAEEIATVEKNVVAVEEIAEEEKLEQLTNEEETEKHEESGIEDTVVKDSAMELPDRQETEENALTRVKEDEKVTDAETSVIEDKAEDSGDEIEEPPVVQRRALRGRRKATPKPKPTKQSKRHQQEEEKHTNEADLGAGGSAREEDTHEQVQEHLQVEKDKMTDKPEEEIPAVSSAVSSAEVNLEKKVVQEEEKTEGVAETITVVEEDKEEEADNMMQEPDIVTVSSETVKPDEGQDETVAEELQENNTDSEIPMLQKATVILVDLKTSCHHFSVTEAEETPAAEECAAPENEQMELKVAERDVSTSVVEEQTLEPEKLVVEEEDRGTQDNITGKSFNTTAEEETEELKDSSEKEKEEISNVDDTEAEEEEALVIETRVLRSRSKTVKASCRSTSRSKQQQEEGKTGEDITEKEAVERETDIVEVEGDMETVEEKPSATSETDADTEVDIPVGDDAEKNLLPAEVDEAVTLDEEQESVVETRALRSGTKTVTSTPSSKTARSREQEEEQDEALAENSEKDEPAVTTRSLRRGRISASATPKGKPRRTRKQVQEAEDEEAAIEKTDQEKEEKTEDEIGEEIKEKAASDKEESLEPDAEVEEGKAVAEEAVSEQDVEQSEVMSETLADVEVQVEECNDEGKPVEEDGEVKSPPVAETRALRSGGKTIKAPRTTRSTRSKQQDDEEEDGGASVEKRVDEDEPPVETKILRRGRKSVSRSRKQLQKEDEAPKELTAEEAQVEGEVVAGLGSAEKPSTEGEEVKATEENKVEVEKEESVAVEVEKGVSEEGTVITIEEENTAGEAAAADEEGETDPPLAKPADDSTIITPCEEEAPSQEEQLSEGSQLSDLQRVSVVLVDLKKTYQEVQDETVTAEEDPQEKTAAMEEVEQRELMEEKRMAEEQVPGSPVGAGQTEQEEVVVQEEGLGEHLEDAVTVHNTDDGSAKETAEVDENKSVDEEEEPAGIKTRTQRSGKEAVKATPRRKSARNRKDDVQQEVEEAASENSEEKTAVRVLRRGRKSFPVTERRATKRTQKKHQEEEEGEESTAAKEQEEQAEEQQQMIDQEKGEGQEEEEDMTPQVENIEPEMSVEKEDTVAEEAVSQDVPEDGQASSSEINDEAVAPAGESADVGETVDDVTEEAMMTQDTVEAEQSTSTSEVDDSAAGESVQETPLTAKDDETKSVSEEEEAPVVQARVLRSGGKTVTATTRRKTTKIQDEETSGEKSTEEDEPTVEARVLRRGRKSAPATPRRKSKRARTQLQTEEEGEQETAPAEEVETDETKAEEKEDTQDLQTEEKDEEQKEENTEPEVEMEKVEPGAEVSLTDQETVEEEQSAVTETSADEQGETVVGESAEETPPTDERVVTTEEETPVVETSVLRRGRKSAPATPRRKSKRARTQLQTEDEEEESALAVETEGEEETPVVETRVLRSGGKTVRATTRRQNTKIQDEEAGLGSAEKPLTEGDEVKATEENKVEVEKEESVAVEVEKGVSEEGTVITIEEENTAGEAAAADEEGETDPPLAKPADDSTIITPCEEEAPSQEEQLSEGSQLSDLQRVSVVLVDLKKTYQEVQDETVTAEEDPQEKTAAMEEVEQRELMEEKRMAEEQVPGSPVGAGQTEQEEVVVQEEGLGEHLEDAVTVHNTDDESAKETAEVDENKSVDEEEEPAGIKTRTQRSGKEAVKATPRRKSARNRKDDVQQEVEEAASENSEEKTAVRVLRRGRKSFPVTERRATKRTQKKHQEEEEGEESTAAKEQEEQAEEQQQMIDQEKGEGQEEEEDMTPQVENIEPEMSVEKEDTVAEEAVSQDVPEDGQASSSEINDEAVAPAGESADVGETVDDVTEEAMMTQDTVEAEQSTSTSEVDDSAAGESVQETPLTAKDDETKSVSEEEEAPVVQARVLRSGGKTVTATTRRKTTKIQDEETSGEKGTEEDEPTVEARVLRRGRKSAPATPRRKSKRARTQLQTEEEGEQETAPAEEVETDETKAEEKEDTQDLQTEEKDEEQKEENTEPEVEMEKVEPGTEVSLTDQETVEEEQSAVTETSADEQGETVVGESAEETPPTDERVVTTEEETPVVETRVLRSGGKTVRATTRRQTTKIQDEEAALEDSTEEDEPTVEARVLRRGMKSAPVTPRRKSKRARTQLQTEDEGEESALALETEEEEEEAGQEAHEEKGKKAEGEAKSVETEVQKDVEENVENGEESTAAEAEQVKWDNNKEAVEETDTVENPTPEIEEMNSAEEEETPVSEKSATTLEVECDTTIAGEEAPVEDAFVEVDQEAPAVTTRTLRSKTKTSHALRRSGRHKDQAVAEIQQQEDENPEKEEEEEIQEVIQVTDDSLENREEPNAKEQAETEETSPTGKEAELPARDATENKAEETADLVDDRVVEPSDEEPVTEEMESPEEELSESKEDKNMGSSASRSLRSRAKTVGDKEDDKAEEIQTPKRRSIRKRPRVDYRENEEEEEEGDLKVTINEEEEDKVESNEPKDIKEAECPADEQIGKESNQEENLENNMGATESTSEKGDVLNLVLDTDEEIETAGMSQEDEEDEQNMSETEVGPIAIGKRVLRRRLVPSKIITPRSNSKRSSAKVQRAESLSDEESEKSPRSAQRSLRKRKGSEVTPARKSKRHSRV